MAAAKPVEAVQREVAKAVKVETDQGFQGTEVDSTPNEHYTVAGVLAGKPTPETDEKQAEKVGSRKFVVK